MKPELIQVEQPKTIRALLTELELIEVADRMFVSVDGVQMKELDYVLQPNQEVMIFPTVSGGSDSTFSIIDKGNRIEIGNAYTELEEEKLLYEDNMAVKLSKLMFIKELEPYASREFIETLIKSDKCVKCKKRLHNPTAWMDLPLVLRKKYFKALVILKQEQIIMCCRCYNKDSYV